MIWPTMKRCHVLCALALFPVLSSPAAAGGESLIESLRFETRNADRLELRLGLASYDTGVLSGRNHSGVTLHGQVMFPSPDFLAAVGAPRPYVGVNLSPGGERTDFLFAGVEWEAYVTDRLYLVAGVGGAIHNADDLHNPTRYKALGCRALFHLSAGLGYDIGPNLTVQVYHDHFSNAGLCSRNQGADHAGVRVGYRF
ncbi:MAG: hypothetical protein DCC69_10240 [Hyphomicrobiales bacterium]|nr:MAG: hypothetical protein DCC69_10240 [Hyphomicrobiales bacterium]